MSSLPGMQINNINIYHAMASDKSYLRENIIILQIPILPLANNLKSAINLIKKKTIEVFFKKIARAVNH